MHADWLTDRTVVTVTPTDVNALKNQYSEYQHYWLLIPKAQASGTNTISHLQLIPPTSSSGMASHKTEPHRYATTTIPQNLTLENGGWNTENKGILKISQTHCYAQTT